MSDRSGWSNPTDQLELQELPRDAGANSATHAPWYAATVFAGIALVCVLGFATDLFDTGPTDLDVSSAYRSGFDRGIAQAELEWEETLEQAWWDNYQTGRSEGTSLSPTLVRAVQDGFSWESGFETGMQSLDIDIDQRFREGWMSGYSQAWTQVTGAAPTATESRFAQLASEIEGEGEP